MMHWKIIKEKQSNLLFLQIVMVEQMIRQDGLLLVLENVEVVDLPVDGDNDMVQSIDTVLD